MYIYLIMSQIINSYINFFMNIFNKIFLKESMKINNNYQSIIFMNFESKNENNNPYFYNIDKIEYKYIECIKDNQLFDKNISVNINKNDFYDNLFNIFFEHFMKRQELFNNPIYIFVKTDNDKIFLEFHLKYLQLYDEYIYIESLENISKNLIELKSYKFKDCLYHFNIQTKNENQDNLMHLYYIELMKLLSNNVIIHDNDNKYITSLQLISNSNEYCKKRKYIYNLFESDIDINNKSENENENEKRDSDSLSNDSTDYNNSSYVNEFILKQLINNPYYIIDYINYHFQLELIY